MLSTAMGSYGVVDGNGFLMGFCVFDGNGNGGVLMGFCVFDGNGNGGFLIFF